jgi:Tol biopolymer transport system component
MSSGVSRRRFLTAGAGVGAGAVVAGALPGVSSAAAPVRERPDSAVASSTGRGRRHDVELRTGTDVAAQISPDGRTIAFDTVGVLWTAPATGGKARRLTDDYFDIAQPDWSPDGKTLAFQSYRDGIFNLWTVRADGTHLEQLTHGPYDHREPRYSPDGRYLAFSSDLAGSYAIYTLDLHTSDISLITDTAAEEYEPAWSPDGKRIAFVVANTEIDVVTLATGARTVAVTVPTGQILHGPAFTPDSKDIVYNLTANGTSRLYRSGAVLLEGEEVFPFRVSWVSDNVFVYTADGHIRRRSISSAKSSTIATSAPITTITPDYVKRRRNFEPGSGGPVKGIGSPVLSPDGKQIAFRALNDIYVMRIGHTPQPLTGDQFWKSDPSWSPDGKRLSYSSDRGGHLEIWVRDLHTGNDTRVASLAEAAAVSGTWSHDGKFIAFLDQTGAVYTVHVESGDIQRVYPATFEPGRPTWSKDGNTIAIAAIKPYSARYREGLSEILTINRTTGEATYHQAVPNKSLQTRGDDGPVWSPDGRKMAFVVASVLWVMPVSADGTPAGAARQITTEVTDAPSWSGDSSRLLYLSGGRLRLVSVDGRSTRTVQVPLRWKNAAPSGRTVIHAGRMWDGRSRSLRNDVDIVVDENRIVSVEPHRAGRRGKKVDASDLVVTPGLIDIHNHREMQGYSYGDRQGRVWLSLGITATRSPGSPAYHMVEERESFQAGRRVGPRYYSTGEAIDGSRIFYNFMRPTYDEDQLALEFARAEALDYDMIKCYVRLSTERQQKSIEWAHDHHIHASSHYHYPAFAFGGDGTEHIGATNRFGYSRTVTALGTGYSDVTDIFASSGARRTPTLFGASALFRDDQSLVVDERVRTLYPTWEYTSLQAANTTARTTDQTVNEANLKAQVQQIVHLLAAGGNVVTGTDSPIDHTAVSTHMNLRAMVAYGVTPHQAMVSATSATGTYLNEPIGQVAPGMLADLAFLGGNPLQDIRQAANVSKVMVNGYLHTIDGLLAPFAGSAAAKLSAPRGNRMLAPVPVPASEERYWWHDPHYLEESKHSCCHS